MLHQLTWIRGIATILVVFLHMNPGRAQASNPYDDMLMEILASRASCIFLAMSGFLFQLNIDRYSYWPYLVRKCKNVVFPYLVVSAPAILIYILQLKTHHTWLDLQGLSQHGIVYQVLFFIATGAHLGPLWFVPVLILLFAAAPIFKPLSRSRLFPILVAIGLLFSLFGDRPAHTSNPLLSAAYFSPFYLSGMLLCQHRSKLERYYVLYGFATIALSLAACFLPDLFLAQKLALFLFLYGLLSTPPRFEPGNPEGRTAGILAVVGSFSFPIYLLHGYVAGAAMLARDYLSPDSFALYVAIRLVLTTLAILFCLGIAMPLKKNVPGLSRQLIGA